MNKIAEYFKNKENKGYLKICSLYSFIALVFYSLISVSIGLILFYLHVKLEFYSSLIIGILLGTIVWGFFIWWTLRIIDKKLGKIRINKFINFYLVSLIIYSFILNYFNNLFSQEIYNPLYSIGFPNLTLLILVLAVPRIYVRFKQEQGRIKYLLKVISIIIGIYLVIFGIINLPTTKIPNTIIRDKISIGEIKNYEFYNLSQEIKLNAITENPLTAYFGFGDKQIVVKVNETKHIEAIGYHLFIKVNDIYKSDNSERYNIVDFYISDTENLN